MSGHIFTWNPIPLLSKVRFIVRQIRLESKVTHHGGITASTPDRSSLSTGWEVGRKLTSPAPIYDITIYLIKGSESALNSCLISERYRKEKVRESAREKKTYLIGKGLGRWKREWVIGRKRHRNGLGAERDGWASMILSSPAMRSPHWLSWMGKCTIWEKDEEAPCLFRPS